MSVPYRFDMEHFKRNNRHEKYACVGDNRRIGGFYFGVLSCFNSNYDSRNYYAKQ